jgi:hypothetical protein
MSDLFGVDAFVFNPSSPQAVRKREKIKRKWS